MATPQTFDIDWIREEYRKIPKDSPIRATAPLSWERLEKLKSQAQQPPRAIPTPWPQLNAAFRGPGGGIGMPMRSTVIVAGSPGFGKSVVGLAFVKAAMEAGYNAALINLEMDELETVTRLLAATSGVPVRALEPGRGFRADLWDAAAKKLVELPGTLWLNPEPTMYGLQHILETIEVLALKFDVRLFVIDYAQLIRVAGARDKREEVETAAHEISQLVKRVDAVGLLLAQLRREAVARELTPGMADIQWSSSLEQDARAVLILDHSRVQKDADRPRNDRFALRVAKMRAGETPDILLDFDRITLTIEEGPTGLAWDRDARMWVPDPVAEREALLRRLSEPSPLDESDDPTLPF